MCIQYVLWKIKKNMDKWDTFWDNFLRFEKKTGEKTFGSLYMQTYVAYSCGRNNIVRGLIGPNNHNLARTTLHRTCTG